jgi:hypothetical protein
MPPTDTPQQIEHFVDANAVASHLAITKRAVLKLARENKLPCHPLTPYLRTKKYRFLLSEIDAFLLGVGASNAGKSVTVLGSPKAMKGK